MQRAGVSVAAVSGPVRVHAVLVLVVGRVVVVLMVVRVNEGSHGGEAWLLATGYLVVLVVPMVVRGVVMVAGLVVRHHRRGHHGQDSEHAGQGHHGLAINISIPRYRKIFSNKKYFYDCQLL